MLKSYKNKMIVPPGTVVRTDDGVVYVVSIDGSWRRVSERRTKKKKAENQKKAEIPTFQEVTGDG